MFGIHRRIAVLIAAASALLAAPGAAHAAIVSNGDFETGTFDGWKTDIVNMPGPSNWFVYGGTTSPLSSTPIAAPPQGTHAAVTDQEEVSRQILYQDVTIPPGGSVNQLILTAYYRNSASGFVSPDSLSLTSGPNQQYRIDVMKPSAPIDSVGSGDVLLNLLRTRTGDPNTLAPTQLAANLTPFAGQTLRLRFAVVTTNSVLNASVDAVSIKSNGFSIAKAKHKRNGSAVLPVTLPDDGSLKASGKGVKVGFKATKSAAVKAGKIKLLIKPKGRTLSTLNATGKTKVKVKITYRPNGVSPATRKVKVKLKK